MKSGLISIMQKELKRFFTDRRMVLSTVLLPALLIYLLYTFMGNAIASNLSVDSDYQPEVYAVNLPDSLTDAVSGIWPNYKEISAAEAESIKEGIAEKEIDILIVFPEDFDAKIVAALNGGRETAAVELFYNSTRVESSAAFGAMQSVLSTLKETIQPLFVVNGGETTYDLASEEDATGFLFASMLPMLLMIFLYTGCISVAPESIAGEKERGTIATLLVTPLKRWELALGKIISLCTIALLSGVASFIAVMLSLPSLMQAGSIGDGESSSALSSSLYGVQDYLMLLVVILSTVILFVSLISVVSAFSRTIKEANTMVMPLMIIVMLVAATAMFQTSSETNLTLYLIPIYNSVQSLVSVFSFNADPPAIALTAAVNLVVSGVCVAALTRMFESERVIFGK